MAEADANAEKAVGMDKKTSPERPVFRAPPPPEKPVKVHKTLAEFQRANGHSIPRSVSMYAAGWELLDGFRDGFRPPLSRGEAVVILLKETLELETKCQEQQTMILELQAEVRVLRTLLPVPYAPVQTSPGTAIPGPTTPGKEA